MANSRATTGLVSQLCNSTDLGSYTVLQSSFQPNSIDQSMAILQQYQEARDANQVKAIFDENMERLVCDIVELVDPFDAFDVIELMRLRELNPIPDPRSSNPDGSASNIEIVTAVLLSRPGRDGAPTPGNDRPWEIIEELHRLASEISKHSVFNALILAEKSDKRASRELVLYQKSRAIISNFQFDEVRDNHDNALLNHEVAKPLVLETLGYSVDHIKSVRDAIHDVQSKRLTEARDTSGYAIHDLMQKYGNVTSGTSEENQVVSDALISMMFRPGNRAAMSVSDIAEQGRLSEDLVEKVITDYSLEFDPTQDALDRVKSLLKGDWLFSYKPLVRNKTGEFVIVTNGIGDDTIRRVFEEKQKDNQKQFQKYDQKVRAKVTEKLATSYLSNLIKADAKWLNVTYAFQAKSGNDENLDSSFNFNLSKCETAESDGLFIKDDVAVVVEVKGKSISDRARTGQLSRFIRDVKDTIGNAQIQAERLSSLIRNNSGIWLASGQWIDFRHVRHILNVVVLLDDVGPVGTQSQDLIDTAGDSVWVVSLHDLAVMSSLLRSPTVFLAYLRCRITSNYGYDIVTVDELDILTQFLSGTLFSHAVDAEVFRRVPIFEPTNGPIDVWMKRGEIPPEFGSVPRPKLEVGPRTSDLVRQVIFRSQRGHMSASIDLVLSALSGGSPLEDGLEYLYRKSVGEHLVADLRIPAVNGSPEIVLTKVGQEVNILDARMKAKKVDHETQSSRLFVFLNTSNMLQSFLRT